jgi:hypothetical protein
MDNPACTDAAADAVLAYIEFLRPTGSRPYTYGYEPGTRKPKPTAMFERRPVVIGNARPLPGLSLDRQGAKLIHQKSDVRDLYDETEVVEVYYAEAAGLIKRHTGARRVVVFDHNVRRGVSLSVRPGQYRQGRPVMHAHTDYTEVSAERRLQEVLGEAALPLPRRFMQVNLWRPISGPLRDTPLAICDASSIAPQQLAPVDLIYPDHIGEIYYLTYDARQRWFHAPDMQPEEAWLLKNYDSASSGPARFAAHSAFKDPAPWSHVPPRESIEVRAFAVF